MEKAQEVLVNQKTQKKFYGAKLIKKVKMNVGLGLDIKTKMGMVGFK
jgi:hypothetical protein